MLKILCWFVRIINNLESNQAVSVSELVVEVSERVTY